MIKMMGGEKIKRKRILFFFFFFKAKDVGLANELGTVFKKKTILIDPIITKKIKISFIKV